VNNRNNIQKKSFAFNVIQTSRQKKSEREREARRAGRYLVATNGAQQKAALPQREQQERAIKRAESSNIKNQSLCSASE
jgi:hypothetical protein